MKIIKFEKKMCPKCNMVQNFFDDKGIDLEKIDIESSDGSLEQLEFISKYVSMTLPVVVLLDENNDLIMKSEGFNPVELEEMSSLLTK